MIRSASTVTVLKLPVQQWWLFSVLAKEFYLAPAYVLTAGCPKAVGVEEDTTLWCHQKVQFFV